MSSNLRLLSLGSGDTYARLLSRVGHDWEVAPRRPALDRHPWLLSRTLPSNMRLVREEVARDRLKHGGYDLVVCHSPADAEWVTDDDTPVLLLFRTSRHLYQAFGCSPSDAELGRLTARATCVFVSEAKRRTWGLEGEVVPPGVDPADYGPFDGNVAAILSAGHLNGHFPTLTGYQTLEALTAGFPTTLVGIHPEHAANHYARSARDRWEAYRRHRLYLNTTAAPYEDGYTFATLEAMASGMPVVSAAHPTSPIEHGVNGFIDRDPSRLRVFVLQLLEDRDLAVTLGRAARQTVIDRFPLDRFLASWQRVIARAANRRVQTPLIATA